MSMSDPIADMLNRIRNAMLAGQTTVEIPVSRVKERIAAVMSSEGFIQGYERIDAGCASRLRLTLKYLPDRTPVIRGLRRVSRPSLRRYVGAEELRPVCSGLGIAIVTTSQGVMTNKQARAKGIGGEILCEVW